MMIGRAVWLERDVSEGDAERFATKAVARYRESSPIEMGSSVVATGRWW